MLTSQVATPGGVVSFRCHLCYKSQMPKIIERWLLFKYFEGEFTPLSKPFKTKAEAEKTRSKLPERERRTIGVGVVRTSG
jgi:hypothetical protein